MKLSELFKDENIETGLPPVEKNALLESIIDDLDKRGHIKNREQALTDVIEREAVMSTGIGDGVAIPHAYTDGVDHLVAGFYRTTEAVDFEALDQGKVDLFFLILGPRESRRDHIKVLARISRLLSHEDFRENLRKASNAKDVMNIFNRFGDK